LANLVLCIVTEEYSYQLSSVGRDITYYGCVYFRKIDFVLEKFKDLFFSNFKKKNLKLFVFVYYKKNHFFLKMMIFN